MKSASGQARVWKGIRMLIKLMKYDLKYMLRSLLPLYLVMIVLGVLAGAFSRGKVPLRKGYMEAGMFQSQPAADLP